MRSVGHSFSRKKKLAALIFPLPPSPFPLSHPPSAIRHPFSDEGYYNPDLTTTLLSCRNGVPLLAEKPPPSHLQLFNQNLSRIFRHDKKDVFLVLSCLIPMPVREGYIRAVNYTESRWIPTFMYRSSSCCASFCYGGRPVDDDHRYYRPPDGEL